MNNKNNKLKDYERIVGKEIIDRLYDRAEPLKNTRIFMINSTKKGGGVAELLTSLVPLLNKLGIKTHWLTLNGNPKFFETTKAFHNALQGDPQINIKNKINYYKKFYNKEVESLNHHIIDYLKNLSSKDIVVIHDPQPLGLTKYRNKKDGSVWIWRQHIDTGNPNSELWNYIYSLAQDFDKIITSKDLFIKGDRKKYVVIPPSIDPNTAKNKKLSQKEINSILKKHKIPTDKPYISQIGRLDKWKDVKGIIEAYKKARNKTNIEFRLFLVYNKAIDDPEGEKMYHHIIKTKKGSYESDIHLIRGDDPKLVNALQSSSIAILQKSLREGFALTVTEALWKASPIIATKVGGIPLQVMHKINGYLIKGYEINEKGEAIDTKEKEKHLEKVSDHISELISDPKKAKLMGKAGKEHIKQHFLITRHLEDYLILFNKLLK